MEPRTIEQTVKEMLVERLFLQVKPDEIPDDAPLMKTLGIDSIQVFEIVVGLEETYGLSFKDEEFNVEIFRSVKTISDFVRAKQGGPNVPGRDAGVS
jgi:acyl carrier protein